MHLIKAHRANPSMAIFLQEHNIKAADKKAFVDLARDFEHILAMAPCPDNAHKGGTAVIIPKIPQRSTFSAVLAKPRALDTNGAQRQNHRRHHDCVEGSTTKLISADAPAQSGPRPNFFSITLHVSSIVTKNTILGIDANCVPNV
eukprot:7148641-Prymnesium_polylepis.1